MPMPADQDLWRNALVLFGRTLRDLRDGVNLTQQVLAGRMGKSNSKLSDLELGKGERIPTEALVLDYIDHCLRAWKADKVMRDARRADLLRAYHLLDKLRELLRGTRGDREHLMRRRRVTAQNLYQTITDVLSRTEATFAPIRFRTTPIHACSPRLLGVRAAIQAEGSEGDLPPYASRDVDASVRAALRRGADAGGLVLLLGEAAVGKTRTLYEALSTELPEWFLFHPDNAAHLRAFAAEPRPNTVVWMDELVGYLNQPDGLTAGTVRGLISAGLLIAGTIWPDNYRTLTAAGGKAGTDLSAEAHETLEMADIMTVATDLSPAEYDRVKELAAVDGRWRAALPSSDASPIQTLAAGPALVVQWESAPAYAKALITFAVDARRMGVASPLTEAALKTGLVGYLTIRQIADAPSNWWRDALNYATEVQHGATSALVPVGDGTMSTVVGYETEDFLLQHGRRTRREVCPPTSFWEALTENISDLGDMQRLAYSATVRWRFRHSEPLYRRLAANGDHRAAIRVAELLHAQNRTAEAMQVLEEHVDDAPAKALLLRLLAEQGHVGVLAVKANSRDMLANGLLVALLLDRGDHENLTARATTGDRLAAVALADLLVENRPRPDTLTEVSRDAHGLDDESCENGPLTHARVHQFTRLLVNDGHIDDAIAFLEACSATAVYDVDDTLADLLAEHGRIDQLRVRAQTGEWAANLRLGELLAAHGQLNEAVEVLGPFARLGVERAISQLNQLVSEHGCGDESNERVEDDPGPRGELSEAEILLGSDPEVEEEIAASERAKTMDAAGRTEDALALLRPYTYGYCGLAVYTLIELLAERHFVEDLRREVDAGADGAAEHWVELEIARGRLSETQARALRAFGFDADGTPSVDRVRRTR